MSRRSKSTTRKPARRPRRAVMPEFEPERPGIIRRFRNALPSASSTIKALVALGIPSAAAYALYNKYPDAVNSALGNVSTGTAKYFIPRSLFMTDPEEYAAHVDGEGIGGARRRRVRKPASRTTLRPISRAKTPARRRRVGRGEGGAAKRPLTAYQKFVKRHRKPGVSMSQVARMWRNR